MLLSGHTGEMFIKLVTLNNELFLFILVGLFSCIFFCFAAYIQICCIYICICINWFFLLKYWQLLVYTKVFKLNCEESFQLIEFSWYYSIFRLDHYFSKLLWSANAFIWDGMWNLNAPTIKNFFVRTNLNLVRSQVPRDSET